MKNAHKNCFGDILSSKNGYDAVDCVKCGFIHILPLPSDKDLEKYYSDIFYSEFKPDYMNQHKKDLKWWNQLYESRRITFEQYININSRSSILDIGSGPGFFLKYFKDNGWKVLGIEPGKAAVDFSKKLGVDVINDSVYNVDNLNLGKFDVIHSNQTFEHLINPKKAIEKLTDMMMNHSLLHVTVANDFNIFQLIAKDFLDISDWWFIPPEHINYFNVKSLSALFERCNLEIIDLKVTFPIDIFLLMGENYIGNPKIGKQSHLKRKNFEKALFDSNNSKLKDELYESFKRLGIGREIEILARKK
jgi:SAM-dependent methyltransferase